MSMNVELARGKVKWFNNEKGYGFIRREGALEDIFVHYSSIIFKGYKSLAEGDEVEFKLIRGDKGLQATDVLKCS